MATILVPTPLRRHAAGAASVAVDGATVGELLDALIERFPGFRNQLLDDAGAVRVFMTLFLNDEDIRMHAGLDTPAMPGDQLELLPAIAGGSGAPASVADWRRTLEHAIPQLTPAEVEARAAAGAIAMIDVRTGEEWAQGHAADAIHIDRGFLELRIEDAFPDREADIVCCCESGTRSLFAAQSLRSLGYRNVANLSGGLKRWREEGRAMRIPPRLSDAARQRYARHIAIPEVGLQGQLRLAKSRVLLVGAGGLGCPAALYLAAAGVGRLGIVDDDLVELSNLQRQVLHANGAVGRPKVESAAESIERLNPDVRVERHKVRLDRETALNIFAGYDAIVDGTDNFLTRYAINDAAAALGKPVVHGSVYRFEGQVSVFWAGKGACYRCLHSAAPPPELAPSCAEAGVLGVLPGTIGLLQATEVLKLLLGIGRPLIDRAIRYDALDASFRELRFARDPTCACCGPVEAAEPLSPPCRPEPSAR